MNDKLKYNGKRYWRNLTQSADKPESMEALHREFPEHAWEKDNSISRRNFLSLMGASLALAGLAGCRRPVDKIIPYVNQPEEVIPGVPRHYATTMPIGLDSYGLLVECHEGRPTKIEGNPLHPSSLGTADAMMQASILGLYDPDRSKRVLYRGNEREWTDFVLFWREQYEKYRQVRGEGLAILSQSFSSPTLKTIKTEFFSEFNLASFVVWDPISEENILRAIEGSTGLPIRPVYHYNRATVILSLDSDFLQTESQNLMAARGFADGRRLSSEKDSMNRLYAVESAYSVTGGMADHRFRLPGRHIGPFAVALAQELKALGLNLNIDTKAAYPEGIFDKKWINVVARDLLSAGRSSLIIAGRRQPSYVHALIMAINDALGAIGNTVTYRKAADAAVPSTDDLAALVEKMNRGNISTLIILEGNPVYNAPSDLKFLEALKKVEHTIHLSLYNDETSQAVEWHIPETHYLESWGDARAVKGTSSVIQPMIEPLYGGHSYLEMLNLVATGRDQRGYDLIRERWKGYMGTPSFDKHWKEILCDGVLTSAALPLRATMIDDINLNRTTASTGPGNESIDYDNPEVVFASAALLSDRQAADNGRRKESNDSMIMNEHQAVTYYPEVIKINYDYLNKAVNSSLPTYRAIDSNNLEVIFASSPHLFDGRFANNGWLQELPDAVTKITWDNPALISPRTAKELNLENGDMVRLDYQGHSLEMPVWIVPGQADYSVILILGYGRKAAGKVGDNVGFDTYKLRTSDAKDFGEGLEIIKTGQTYKLAVTQEHQSMEGRPLVREATLDEYRRQPDFAPQMVKHAAIESIFTEHKYDRGYQWGMAIDLNACIGCNACTIACQSENNIPIVGKEQVARGREMHWIRNDRYFVGDIDSPEMVHQPVACQHCENAPCETVCPVAATVHDREGLNVMTYNRCIGTRYCSNNCPYKVRRFNFFNYTNKLSETIKMAQNPEVTVRSRGVMEKCTFCVQRISHAKARAKLEGREVRDGELVTACQQTCPARAIVFGNINDPESEIARIKKQNRNYQILAEFNTRPRNSYLARIRNPHPELENYKPITG